MEVRIIPKIDLASAHNVPLKRRVINAGAWTFAGYGLSLVIRLGSNLLLTRLLAPEMFGVMSIAMITVIGLTMFSDLGLTQSVVRSQRGDQPLFVNTVWAVQILRGLLLWSAALAVCMIIVFSNNAGISPKNSVYENSQLPGVIAILSFVAVIDGFVSTKAAQARRKLDAARLTQLDIASQLVGLCCMFAWVLIDRSIWALVAGALGASFAKAVLSHIWLKGDPNRWQWDWSAFSEIFGFGKWIFVSSILGFLVANSDRLLLGGLVSATALGIFTIAFMFANSVDMIMARVVAAVAFPALSEIARERHQDIKRGYYKFHTAVAAISYLCAGLLVTSGHVLIDVLYDHRYADAGWMLEVLAVGLFAVPFQVATQCYLALGLPQIQSRVLVVRLVVLVLALPAGFYGWGLAGALWGIVASQLTPLIIVFISNAKLGLLDLRRELVLLTVIPLGLLLGVFLSRLINYKEGLGL
jgi:O-antigen/teichoic acid export membrane protein